MLKLFKQLVNPHTILSFNDLNGVLPLMLRGFLPQNLEFGCHLLANDISSVTKILKSFNPDQSCSLNSLQEHAHPEGTGTVEKAERQANY